MRVEREQIAQWYLKALSGIDAIELPPVVENRIHAWHLFPIRLRLEKLRIDRNAFIEQLRSAGVGCSVHWRPLHLHPYYMRNFGWTADQFPVATPLWQRLVSLPLFPGMRDDERDYVAQVVRELCQQNRA
jgi:perosamine synthetase